MDLNLIEEETLRIPGEMLPPHCIETIEKIYAEYFSFWWERSGDTLTYALRSKGYVGLFPLGPDGVIRVETKIPSLSVWRMIACVIGIFDQDTTRNVESIKGVSQALVGNYVRIVEERIGRGLLWDYQSKEERGQPIRGKIIGPDVNRPALVRCRYEEGGYDHGANQRILWTLHTLSAMVWERELSEKIRLLFTELSQRVSLKPTANDPSPVRYPLAYFEYRTLDVLSKFILTYTSPSISIGQSPSVPFVFHMPTLFEEAVASWMERSFSGSVIVKRQWTVPLRGNNAHHFRLDLALLAKETLQPLAVFDTKYKMEPSPSTSDLQQVVSYAVLTGAKNAVILYPQRSIQPTELYIGSVRVQSLGFDFQKRAWDDMAADIKAYVEKLILSHK